MVDCCACKIELLSHPFQDAPAHRVSLVPVTHGTHKAQWVLICSEAATAFDNPGKESTDGNVEGLCFILFCFARGRINRKRHL